MRIAQIAPLFESVPPRMYGGTERVVSYLTEELVKQGHRVILFASGDSATSAELVPCSPAALRLDPTARDPNAECILKTAAQGETSRHELVAAAADQIQMAITLFN
jgi:Glycosyltransferase Family 4